MYVLVNNGSVILGPMAWNYRMFESSLMNDLEIDFQLPRQKTDDVIIDIDANTKIMPARYESAPAHNPKIQFPQGPYWTFSPTEAVGNFVIEDLPIDAVRNMLKERVAINRWVKEIEGIKVTLQGSDYTIDTNRGSRDIFLQAMQLNAGGNTWKFPEGWLTLSTVELQAIVTAIMTHVQTQFAWEGGKVTAIMAAATLAELDAIDLGDPSPAAP